MPRGSVRCVIHQSLDRSAVRSFGPLYVVQNRKGTRVLSTQERTNDRDLPTDRPTDDRGRDRCVGRRGPIEGSNEQRWIAVVVVAMAGRRRSIDRHFSGAVRWPLNSCYSNEYSCWSDT